MEAQTMEQIPKKKSVYNKERYEQKKGSDIKISAREIQDNA